MLHSRSPQSRQSGCALYAVFPKPSLNLLRKGATLVAAALALSAGPKAMAQTPTEADTLTNAFNTAFYDLSGSNGVYWLDTTKTTLPGGVSWTDAEEIEMMIDAYNRSLNSSYLTMINDLINGYVAQNGSLWTSDSYNDDILWMTIACERAYQVTGNSTYASLAQTNFNAVYSRGYSTALGGGIWESTSQNSKTSCANCPAVISACYLYSIYGTSSILSEAESLYSWERATLFNTSTGCVSDNISSGGAVTNASYTYNQGTFIGAANALYGITGTSSYLSDAELSASYTQNTDCTSGILPSGGSTGDGAGFNGYFVRWLGIFAQERGLWGAYYSWMDQNAEAAWNVLQSSTDLSWDEWTTATPTGTLQSWACTDSVVMLNVIPSLYELNTLTVPSYSGPDYRIISDSNFRDGSGVILDSTAVGQYINFLVPEVSARSYDVRVNVKKLNTRGIFQLAIGQSGNNSPSNFGAPQDLYSASAEYVQLDLGIWTPATSTDKWFWFTITGKNTASTGYDECFDYILLLPMQTDPRAGTHAIVNEANGMAIDNGHSDTQGAGMLQWDVNGQPQQEWQFTQNSDSSWTITSVYSGLVLEVPGGSKTAGTTLDQWGSNGGSNQHWFVNQQSDGSYEITNVNSGDAIDNNASTTEGTAIVQQPLDTASEQRWFLQ